MPLPELSPVDPLAADLAPIDCAIGEELRFGGEIRIWFCGRDDDALYVYIDTLAAHRPEGVDGFRTSAPIGRGRRVHVLALRDHDRIAIGPVQLQVLAVRRQEAGLRTLRDVALCIGGPPTLPCTRARRGRG
jgi:hypothetical protein